MTDPRPAVTSLEPGELAAHLDVPLYRARQIRAWVVDRAADSFARMTDLPKDMRSALPDRLRLLSSEIVEAPASPDGTEKLLVRMEDEALVECVLIPEGARLTLCMSSQVGCPAGCAFCASGLRGLERNLASHEILEQYLHAARRAGGRDRITNVVMMGMGEPLLNYDAVVAAVRALPLGARRITVSTVGLPDRMRRLAREGRKVNLAVSLHAPDDETRDRLVPVNRKFGVAEVVRAARDYFEETGRDVTFEYILIDGENASPEHAERLAALLGTRNLNVNLIPMNPVEGLPYRPPPHRDVDAFRERLQAAGIPTHVRRPRGREIDGACGQLRLRRLDEGPV
ncbi:MAG: dual-specificity RNA methyltransferase RlmN [Planctomycetota bacterium]|jgi:23S rRNA (adenine2503-C2)-methyltransferase